LNEQGETGTALVAAGAERNSGEAELVAPPRVASNARVLQLDILRGVAILLVLCCHSPSAFRRESGRLRIVDLFMHNFGWTGVDLFFVLSGFLIGGLLFNEIKRYGALDVPRFLMRRMLRIWPAYYCLLVVIIVRLMFEHGESFGTAWSKTWPAFVHIQNFIEVPRPQLWSLAIEEHFYLAMPLFLWFLTRKTKSGGVSLMPWACAFMSVVCLALRSFLLLVYDIETRMAMDALFFGVNLAYLKAYQPALLERFAERPWRAVAAACVLFLPAALNAGKLRLTIGLTFVYLGYAAILVVFTHARPGKWSEWRLTRLIAYIGTHSYSIYLWHRDTSWGAYELALSFGRRLGLPTELTWTLHTLAYIAASILGGVILGRLIETPVQHVRERLFPSRLGTAVALARP
jgi:peptidoglycan/LPS O-acetylase OafA/YrhL